MDREAWCAVHESQRVGYNWATELNWKLLFLSPITLILPKGHLAGTDLAVLRMRSCHGDNVSIPLGQRMGSGFHLQGNSQAHILGNVIIWKNFTGLGFLRLPALVLPLRSLPVFFQISLPHLTPSPCNLVSTLDLLHDSLDPSSPPSHWTWAPEEKLLGPITTESPKNSQ